MQQGAFFDKYQAADYLGVGAKTFERWQQRGAVPSPHPLHPGGRGRGRAARWTTAQLDTISRPKRGRIPTAVKGPTAEEIDAVLLTMTDEVRSWLREDLAFMFFHGRRLGLAPPRPGRWRWLRAEVFQLLEALVFHHTDPKVMRAYVVELVAVRFLGGLRRRPKTIAKELGMNVTRVQSLAGDWQDFIGYAELDLDISDRMPTGITNQRDWYAAAKQVAPEVVERANQIYPSQTPQEIERLEAFQVVYQDHLDPTRSRPRLHTDEGRLLGQDEVTERDVDAAALAARWQRSRSR